MNIKTIVAFLALAVCGISAAQSPTNPVTLAASTTPVFSPGQSLNTGKVVVYNYAPAQNATFTAYGSGVAVGATCKLIITTASTTSYALTFSTGFNTKGTLQTGTTSGQIWVIDFAYDGTTFQELGRSRENNPTVVIPVVATTSTVPYSDGTLLYTFTPTAAVNLTVDNIGRAGATMDILILSDGTGRTVTLTSNLVKNSGTIASASTTDAAIRFVSDGTLWHEVSRVTSVVH